MAKATNRGQSTEMTEAQKELAEQIAQASKTEEIDLAQLLQSLDIPGMEGESAQWDILAAGAISYWPMVTGSYVCGRILSRIKVNTKFGEGAMYTCELVKPSYAINRDGELYEAMPGEVIYIFERAILHVLQNAIGRIAVVTCDGKGMTKDGKRNLWNFRVVAQRQNTAAPQLKEQATA